MKLAQLLGRLLALLTKLNHAGEACVDKHSTLLGTLKNNGRKKFYNTEPRVQCYKAFKYVIYKCSQ